jgi:hypothetical protein
MSKNIVAAMIDLVDLFARHSSERSTLDELQQMLPDRPAWKRAHGLFDRIRGKNLNAAKQENLLLVTQYRFEEACAKTLYNIGYHPAPFDAPSPYLVVPSAFELARLLKSDDLEIVHIISPRTPETQI